MNSESFSHWGKTSSGSALFWLKSAAQGYSSIEKYVSPFIKINKWFCVNTDIERSIAEFVFHSYYEIDTANGGNFIGIGWNIKNTFTKFISPVIISAVAKNSNMPSGPQEPFNTRCTYDKMFFKKA